MSKRLRSVQFPSQFKTLTWASLSLVAVGALAQSSGGTYEMKKQVIASGGGQASGGTFDLVGTVGQHEARSPVSGGSIVLHSGFHTPLAPSTPLPDALFKNGFEN